STASASPTGGGVRITVGLRRSPRRVALDGRHAGRLCHDVSVMDDDVVFDNRVTRALGVRVPILQAPMGFVAKPKLVAAVAEAGAMGLVPGSLGTDMVRDDIHRTRDLTDKPFGLNLPIAFLQDPSIIDMVVDEGIRFITTSAGSP